ncbi:hypothetical protein ABZY90_11575 [Streptomyces sp. NPDC006422]|uniref:hypothetical protein n=1 Tax=unclassified Streptomyces TaxID=2593676 RepID=UPI0033B164A4
MLAPLRKHLRDPSGLIDVGPGWWHLALECHQAVAAQFPEYELLAVKQKWATLSFQAFPRPWTPGGGNWTDAERSRLRAITDFFAVRSESVCERCGADGSLRESRWIELTLCEGCEALVPGDGRL